MKETDLFPPLKQWLEERGYDVYTEVESRYTGGRADIVAVAGPAVAVVEMKLSLSLDLIAQAVRWKPFANYVYVAVPRGKRRNSYGDIILAREGIGFIEIVEWHEIVYTSCLLKPKFNRRVNDHLLTTLVPQHKELPGGHAGGGYVTPYKITIDKVKRYLWSVRENGRDGWVTIKEILDHCETHYAAPKPSLSKALREFEHDWCETKLEGGKLWFRIAGSHQFPEVRA